MITNFSEAETKKINEQLDARQTNTVNNLLLQFGVEGIFEAAFNAINATVSNYYYQAEEAADYVETRCWLKCVMDDVYVLCEKGKAEAALIDAYQRKQSINAKSGK